RTHDTHLRIGVTLLFVFAQRLGHGILQRRRVTQTLSAPERRDHGTLTGGDRIKSEQPVARKKPNDEPQGERNQCLSHGLRLPPLASLALSLVLGGFRARFPALQRV